jgi:hypothetical protein
MSKLIAPDSFKTLFTLYAVVSKGLRQLVCEADLVPPELQRIIVDYVCVPHKW